MNGSKSRMRWWLGMAVVVALTLLVVVWNGASETSVAVVAGKYKSSSSMPVASMAVHFVTGTEGLPHSLQGTDVPNGLLLDASGHLLITHALRDLFDYFLSAMGEEPLPVLLARIKSYIHHAHLPAAAEAQALHILDEYVAYKKALSTMPEVRIGSQVNRSMLQQKLTELNQMRQQYLDPDVVQAFFGSEQVYDQFTLNRMAIMQDRSLTAADRATALANALSSLPDSLRQSMQTQIQYESLQDLTKDWKHRGGSPQELRQIRENLLGTAATDRLEALDQEQAAFQAKVQQYQQQEQQISANTSLSSDERQNAVDQLRSNMFNPQEQLRVRALEQEQSVAKH